MIWHDQCYIDYRPHLKQCLYFCLFIGGAVCFLENLWYSREGGIESVCCLNVFCKNKVISIDFITSVVFKTAGVCVKMNVLNVCQ